MPQKNRPENRPKIDLFQICSKWFQHTGKAFSMSAFLSRPSVFIFLSEKQVVQHLGRGLVRGFDLMGIDHDRCLQIGVAETFGHRFQIHTLGDHNGCVRMPERMQMDRRQIVRFHKPRKPRRDGIGVQISSHFIGEDKIGILVHIAVGGFVLRLLFLPMVILYKMKHLSIPYHSRLIFIIKNINVN